MAEIRAKRSKVWAHFIKQDGNTSKCNICKHVVSCKGGNTSNLMKHLKTQHSLNVNDCTVFDCFRKATAAPTSTGQPLGSGADGLCQTISMTVATTSSQGNIGYYYKLSL